MASLADKAETFLLFFNEERMCLCIRKEPGCSFRDTVSRELQIFNEVLSVFSFCLSQQQWTFPSEETKYWDCSADKHTSASFWMMCLFTLIFPRNQNELCCFCMTEPLACGSLKTDIVYSLGRQKHCRAQSRAGNWAVGTHLVILRQTVCRRGTQKPCYKIVYFHDASRRTSYEEAHLACRADGGHLVSIETPAEQRLIESFIRSLLASDGDFWIGLRRRKEEEDNSTECHNFYSWSDGSSSKFRNWYVDEPSCGGEVCVVLYHQPSAPPGLGGPYMFQWNDDRCNMKNNFICKYSLEKPTKAPIENSRRAMATEPWKPEFPEERRRKGANGTAVGAKEPVQNLAYILISSVPVLLLLMAITGISCFWLLVKRRRERVDAAPKGDSAWLPPPRRDSPRLDIYRVINKQSDADLAGARPATKNSSFRAQEGLGSPCRDPEDLNTSSSGFVTLASTESGFVTNDIYELCGDRVGRSQESTWVDNEIYGY